MLICLVCRRRIKTIQTCNYTYPEQVVEVVDQSFEIQSQKLVLQVMFRFLALDFGEAFQNSVIEWVPVKLLVDAPARRLDLNLFHKTTLGFPKHPFRLSSEDAGSINRNCKRTNLLCLCQGASSQYHSPNFCCFKALWQVMVLYRFLFVPFSSTLRTCSSVHVFSLVGWDGSPHTAISPW